MAIYKTSNPALGTKTFQTLSRIDENDRMTLAGTINKSFLLIALLLISATWSWKNYMAASAEWAAGQVNGPGWFMPLLIGTFVISLVIIFKKTTAPYLAWVYAILEGLLLGAISAMYENAYQGIVLQAVMATVGVFVTLLMAYKSQLIRATENFKLGVVAATGGIAFLYIASMVLGFFNISMPFLHDSSPLSIGISVVIVVVAALNLVLDFDFIEKGAEGGAPKYMEWYASFGLLITLVWLYLEILKLLSKMKKK